MVPSGKVPDPPCMVSHLLRWSDTEYDGQIDRYNTISLAAWKTKVNRKSRTEVMVVLPSGNL